MEQRDGHADGFQVALPDACLFKARAATEGDSRFVYCEPSNENWDAQNEKVLQTALAASAAHFLTFGNIDIDHLSLLGPRYGLSPAEAKLYEIMRPARVRGEGGPVDESRLRQGAGQPDGQSRLAPVAACSL